MSQWASRWVGILTATTLAACLAATGLAQSDVDEPAGDARVGGDGSAGGRRVYGAAEVRESIDAATAYLLRTQNDDGSWGGSQRPAIGIDDFWSNPETHRSWTIATTGLVCMAMLQMPASGEIDAAYENAIDYLLDTGMIKRPSEWDTDNAWALVYAVQIFARAATDGRYDGTERGERIRFLGQAYIDKLLTYQTPDGGWGYYDFEAHARRPAWATSFMTAAAVLGLIDAKAAGLQVPDERLAAAVRAVERCRLPNGAYAYSVSAVPNPGRATSINRVKGSLCRIQVGNLALLLSGRPVSHEDLRTGLDQFFEHHRFLDIARKKPIPHESYYANSGYFYFFGHYYAAGVIEQLPPAERGPYWRKLEYEIIKTQESDGSMWDYYMNSYHRPYGVAFGLLCLLPSMEQRAESVE